MPKIYAKEMVDCHHCQMKRLPKTNELPLYQKSETVEFELVEDKDLLKEKISFVRKSVSKYVVALDVVRKRAVEVYHTGLAHTKSTYDYITEDENIIPRSLVIASGGLLGLLFSARGGLFKKIIYSSTGITSVAAVCYPKDAKYYLQTSINYTKDKSSQLLKEHAGYDVEKVAHDTKEKIASLTSTTHVQDIYKRMKEWINKKSGNDLEVGDHGQSNPADEDLYTTRK